MPYQQIRDYFTQRRAEMLAVIQELVSQETPSDDKVRLDAFAEYLARRMSGVGAQVDIVSVAERGNHVRARFGHDRHGPDVKQALILCHFDTVWPVGSLATHPCRVDEEGKAYGPGIFDMQSSLVLAEYALRAIGDLDLALSRPVTVLMTSDEEVGSYTSRSLIEEEGRRAAYVLVMESPLPGGVVKTERKGGGGFTLTVTGRAAHAGVEPEKGISAIYEMAQQIMAIHALSDWEKGTTVSVGTVDGGTATNVIPASAVATVDIRAWTKDEVDRVIGAVNALTPITPGAELTINGGANRPPLERAITGELFGRAQVVGRKVGLELEEGATGGGSDASWTASLGIPTLDGLGVPGHGAHADHEHIEVEHLPGRAALLTALLLDL